MDSLFNGAGFMYFINYNSLFQILKNDILLLFLLELLGWSLQMLLYNFLQKIKVITIQNLRNLSFSIWYLVCETDFSYLSIALDNFRYSIPNYVFGGLHVLSDLKIKTLINYKNNEIKIKLDFNYLLVLVEHQGPWAPLFEST